MVAAKCIQHRIELILMTEHTTETAEITASSSLSLTVRYHPTLLEMTL